MNTKKEINKQIGERIKKSRETANLTQERFAELMDLSVQFVSDLERGKTGTSIPTLIKICNVLNVSSDYLLLGKNVPDDSSAVIERLKYLPSKQQKSVESIINIILETFSSQN